MAVKLLSLCLLLGLLCPSWAKAQTCSKLASTCSECLQAGLGCAWCSDPGSKIRCHTPKVLRNAGCGKRQIYHPKGGVQVVRNDSRTEPADAVFLQPQALNVSLRPGVGQSFPLTITLDQPVTELTLDTSPVPAGVNITFDSISNGNPLVIQVNVEAAQCLSESDNHNPNQKQNSTGSWSVQITPRGFSLSLELQLTWECLCDCIKDRVENSPACSGHGALVCGQCECNEPFFGQHCQRKSESYFSPNEDSCRSGRNASVCSGRGDCVEGFCDCHKPENLEGKYTGQFCECSNFDCPRFHNMMCGGHGRCVCGECFCDADWTGDACSCSMETASCMANNKQLCNGNGMCQCGRCRCTPPYTGPTCETCPVCVGVCQQHRECVECRAFGTGRKKDKCDEECGYFTMAMVETEKDLTPISLCKMMGDDSCFFYYTFSTTPSGGQATVAQAKECPAGRGK